MPATDDHSHILLLTGRPGVGKTTLLCRVAEQLLWRTISGFYTEELREAGQRVGFRLVTYTGDAGIIAHVNFDHRHRVGKYGVDVATVDRFAAATLAQDRSAELYLVDEIGKMECMSDHFVQRIETLLSSNRVVVATVAQKGGGLIERAKQWPGSELWEITQKNRDSLVPQIIAWLAQRYPTK